jgi:hypothetical protein
MTNLSARRVFANEKRTVSVLVSIALETDTANGRHLLTGSLTPIAVIVREAGRTYAVDMDAQPVDVEQLDLPTEF